MTTQPEWRTVAKVTLKKGFYRETEALPVVGGWYVRTVENTGPYSEDVVVDSIFVPDPKHEWVFDRPVEEGNR